MTPAPSYSRPEKAQKNTPVRREPKAAQKRLGYRIIITGEKPMTDMFDEKSIDEMTLVFLESKGFKPSDLSSALDWLKSADPDDLMLGDKTGESFDVTMGELRRPMLIASVERLIAQASQSEQEKE